MDRSSDLAVIRVEGKGLPDPLPVSSAKDLKETQNVFLFGFPFGKQLGKNITIGQSSISSLRKNTFGILHQIQLNGGVNPGNSGGPVVDADGKVVAVVNAAVPGAQIGFAVPGDYVHVILNGRVVKLDFGRPYFDGGSVKVGLVMQLLDPLARIQKASLQYWTAPPSTPRPASWNGRRLVLTDKDGRVASGAVCKQGQQEALLAARRARDHRLKTWRIRRRIEKAELPEWNNRFASVAVLEPRRCLLTLPAV